MLSNAHCRFHLCGLLRRGRPHDYTSASSFCVAGLQDEKLKTARLDFIKLREYEEVHRCSIQPLATWIMARHELASHRGICTRTHHSQPACTSGPA